jgi:hypothetical protein
MHHGTLSSVLVALSCLLAGTAHAASDLRVTVPTPAAQHVDELTAVDVVVANIGNQTAAATTLTITLPATHTSPTKYVLGTLGAVDPRCSKSGTRLICNLGNIAKNTGKTVSFQIALPVAAEALTIQAAATTTSSENSLANNAAAATPPLLYHPIAVADDAAAHNRHCTGTGLVAFFECELFPSAISAHDLVLHPDGSLTFVDAPDLYTGAWWQDSPDSLDLVYFEGDTVVAEFSGRGAGSGCFEGLTTFPGSTYVSPYEVCL